MTGPIETERYENPALWEQDRFTPADQMRADVTASWVPSDAISVLDAGCGSGLLTERLSRGRPAVGVDRSRYALEQFTAPRCQANVSALPFAAGAFDCVVCAEVIEHLPLALYEAVLGELARVSRRYILITVPYCEELLAGHVMCPLCGCRFNANYHLRSFNEQTLRMLFKAQPGIRLAQIDGLAPEPARRLNRLWTALLLIRYDVLGAPGLARHMQCPHCGYRPSHQQAQAPAAGAPRLRVASAIERFWPKRTAYRWWIALYEKAQP